MIVEGDDFGLLAKNVKHDYQLFTDLSLVVKLADSATNTIGALVLVLRKLADGGTLSKEGAELSIELARELEENEGFALETGFQDLLKSDQRKIYKSPFNLIQHINSIRNRLQLD